MIVLPPDIDPSHTIRVTSLRRFTFGSPLMRVQLTCVDCPARTFVVLPDDAVQLGDILESNGERVPWGTS